MIRFMTEIWTLLTLLEKKNPVLANNLGKVPDKPPYAL